MDNYILGKRDFDQIETVIKLSEAIEEVYAVLYQSEINNKEFNINSLLLALNLEKSKYKEFNLNLSKCVAWCNYLLEEKLCQNYIDIYKNLMELDYKDRVIMRVIKIVADIMYENKVKQATNSVKMQLEEKGYYIDDEIIKRYLCNDNMLEDAMLMDVLRAYLYFLQNCIEDEKYSDIKDYLISAKYNMSFLLHDIENLLVANDFKIPKDLYLNSKFVSDLLNFDDDHYNSHKNSYGKDLAFDNALDLLEITDREFNDKEGKICAVLRKCMINASLLLISDKDIENLNYYILTHIENHNMYYMNRKNSKYILSEVFDEARKNRDIPKVISLVKNKQ